MSRYYDPVVGRFINADALLSTGQGVLGYNMFAYCMNNPVLLSDDTGKLGILGSLFVGLIVGVVTQYVCDVVENVAEGKKGADILEVRSTLGEYVASGVSGAVAAIPGAPAVVSVASDLIVPAIEQGIDYLTEGDEWNWKEYADDTISNVVSDALGSQFTADSPEFIRDIKEGASSLGIKGTKNLNKFLKSVQNRTFFYNQMSGAYVDVSLAYCERAITVYNER